jgi:hypothetical protein
MHILRPWSLREESEQGRIVQQLCSCGVADTLSAYTINSIQEIVQESNVYCETLLTVEYPTCLVCREVYAV